MIWADAQRISGSRSKPKIWVVEMYRSSMDNYGNPVDYIWVQYEVSCSDQATQIVSMAGFTVNGEVSGQVMRPQGFQLIVPDSVGEGLYSLTCRGGSKGRKSLDQSPEQLLKKFRNGTFDLVDK